MWARRIAPHIKGLSPEVKDRWEEIELKDHKRSLIESLKSRLEAISLR